jgi:hypothetical protein
MLAYRISLQGLAIVKPDLLLYLSPGLQVSIPIFPFRVAWYITIVAVA